jgi:citrate lyase subunit beta/citryl-CoA lyase
MRSLLYVPGTRPDLFAKAIAGSADGVILDLEDGVPLSAKDEARRTTLELVCAHADAKNRLLVRINVDSLGIEDASALASAGAPIRAVMVPKSERGDHIAALARILDSADSTGPAICRVRIQPIIETVAGLYSIGEQAAASSRVRRFSFGAGDFVIDLGGTPTPERTETLAARSEIVMRSRLLDLEAPVAHVFGAFKDDEGLRIACMADRALGFGGRSCIHPGQIDIVNSIFGVSNDEIRRARLILTAFEENAANGVGAFKLADGTFVDEAVARGARAVLARSVD